MAREQELPFDGGFSGADIFPGELACYTIGKGQVPSWPLCRGYCASPRQRRARAPPPLICIRMKSVSLESKPARVARAENVNNKMSARLCARAAPFFPHLLFSTRSRYHCRRRNVCSRDGIAYLANMYLALRYVRVGIGSAKCALQTFIFISIEILSWL